jgi:DNA ligase-1
MDEKSMMHGKDWAGQDLSGWLLSEKYDGCRGFWDGSTMWTKGGKKVKMPAWFAKQLPSFPVDGEIWAGRGHFNEASLATRLGRFDRRIRFVIFDCPGPGIWIDRFATLNNLSPRNTAVKVPKIKKCRSTLEAISMMKKVQSKGGEGLIARHPSNLYKAGRFSDILKLK